MSFKLCTTSKPCLQRNAARSENHTAFQNGKQQISAQLLLEVHKTIFLKISTGKQDADTRPGHFRDGFAMVGPPALDKRVEALSREVGSPEIGHCTPGVAMRSLPHMGRSKSNTAFSAYVQR